MTEAQIDRIIALLRGADVPLAPGLKSKEIARAERTFGFRFPPDLRQLLETTLPLGNSFPDWRNGVKTALQDWLEVPLKGICFDIEHAHFWRDDWGPRPDNLADAFAVARQVVSAAPRLIPISGHRYLPDDPCEAGNPVFSVHQTDIIYYGADLSHYFENEFAKPRPAWEARPVRPIRFWSDLTTW